MTPEPRIPPEGWRRTALGEALERIEAGWSPNCEGRPASEDEWGVLKVSSVSGGRFNQHENKALTKGLEPRPEIQVAEGDVLVARASGVLDLVGRSVYVNRTRPRLMLSDKTLRLRVKDSMACPVFLNLLLNSLQVRRQILAGTTGSHMRNVSQRALRLVQVSLPPLAEQRKIAAILSSVDDAIEKTQAVIDQVQVVKRGLMQELLTRGLPGRHTRFKQTEIGEIPNCWRLTVLGEALEDIEPGWSPKCEGRPAEEGEWGVLKVSSVSGGRFKPEENKALTKGLKPRPEIQVVKGDLLVARASGVLDLVGRSVYVHQTRLRLMLSDKTLRLRVKGTVARPLFLNILLSEPKIRKQVLVRTTGSHMRNISQRAIRRVPIPLPSIEEQEKIEALELDASRVLRLERKYLEQLGTMKSALMSVLLTGELRVTPDTVAA